MRKLTIGNKTITDNNVFVIAEIGSNHQGDPDLCERMIRKAAECGADAVKLQKRDRSMLTETARMKPRDQENSFGKTEGEHRDFLDYFNGKNDNEMFDLFIRFKNIAESYNIQFFATPFTLSDVDFLHRIGVNLWKIASCDVTNIPLVKKIAQYGKPMIISTGGASIRDICDLVDAIEPINNNFALLHCVSTYPNTDENINLRVIQELQCIFVNHVIGFSSHHPGVDALKDSVKVGARILEAHFTLNRSNKGTDNSFSLEPRGLSEVCEYSKRYFIRLGNGKKQVLPEEKEGFVKKMGKSIYVKRPILAGNTIEMTDLCVKSPAGGLKPAELDNIVGKIAINDLSTGIPVKGGDLR